MDALNSYESSNSESEENTLDPCVDSVESDKIKLRKRDKNPSANEIEKVEFGTRNACFTNHMAQHLSTNTGEERMSNEPSSMCIMRGKRKLTDEESMDWEKKSCESIIGPQKPSNLLTTDRSRGYSVPKAVNINTKHTSHYENTSNRYFTSKSSCQKISEGQTRTSNVVSIESNVRNLGTKTRPYVSKRNINKEQSCDVGGSSIIGPLPRPDNNSCKTKQTASSDFIGPIARPENWVTSNSTAVNKQTSETTSTGNYAPTVNRPPRRVRFRIGAHTQGINRIQWTPVQPSLLTSCSMDHTVGIWDTHLNGVCKRRFTFHGGAVKDVKWSPCGTKVLSCGYDKCARLVDLEAGVQVTQFHHPDYVTCVQYHPTDPNVFLSGSSRTGIKSWDVRTEKVISLYQASFGQVQDLVFLPNGQQFISAAEVIRRNSTDKGIMAWDFKTSAVLSNQIYQEAFTCTRLKVHPSGSHFVAQSNGNYLAIFSTKRPYKLNKYKRFEGHKVSAYWIGCDFSPDGSIVLSGSADGKMYVYNHRTSHLINALPGHATVCMDTSFHPTLPSTVASCSWEGDIIVWT